MEQNNFITSLKKTGTHPLQLVPDPRTEKFLNSPLTEGMKLINDGETAIPLLERIYRFALRQVLVDYTVMLDMAPFKETVETYVETELAYAKADPKEVPALRRRRKELVGTLIQLRKEQTGERQVRNRHEGYGLLADAHQNVIKAMKSLKDGMGDLLDSLAQNAYIQLFIFCNHFAESTKQL